MYTQEVLLKFIDALKSGQATKLDYGWTYSDTFKLWQKVNNQVYCYVAPKYGFMVAQCYKRKDTSFCSLEARCYNYENLGKLFELCDEWLDKYGDDNTLLPQDPHAIGQYFDPYRFENEFKK